MTNKIYSSAIGIFLLTILSTSVLHAQNVTQEDYKRAEQFLWSNVDDLVFRTEVDPHWADEVPMFWYELDTRAGSEYFVVDAPQATKRHFFDHKKLAENLSEVLDEEVDPYDLPLDELEWNQPLNEISFEAEDKKWNVDLETLEVHQVEEQEDDPDWQSQRLLSESPDGKWTVTRKEYNLWLKNNDTGEEYQLTEDGTEKMIYGASVPWSWKKQEGPEEKEREPLWLNVSWSEDSQKLFAHLLDLREAKLMYLLQNVPEKGFRAKSYSYYRALPGEDSVARQIPYVFDIESKTRTRLKAGPYDDLVAGSWNWFGEGSSTLYMLMRERGYGSATLLQAHAETGTVDTVFSEVSETYVDPNKSELEILPKTREVIWLSERDGWNHIYLYDLESGEVKHQVTQGEFVVYDIEHIDRDNHTIFFTAGGREPNRDPYLEHPYSVNFDGSDLTLLTPENATHEIEFSSDHEYFVDNYSRVDRKPQSVLRRSSDGSVVMKLEEADIQDLQATGWQYPEPFSVKARDGETDIYGVIYRPTNFDPDKKYPVIDGTYSGPQAVRTPKSFGGGYRNSDQPLAELGFIVITVDGLGTAGRSKAFQDYSWKNLGDIGGPDHIKAIRELAERYPYLDTTRVGIYGHSAGGYDAARAVMKYPDFYKVAVSSSGNHDHRVAKAWWPELYMDYPDGQQYEEQSNINLAENLEGKLLLAHGDMDDNVHPSETMRMADALIKVGKDFDMLIMPNKTHGLGSENNYFTIKRWNYFVEHLMGAEPLWHYASE
ncbi:prolyl oligopeptidase family serine peptidase [Aliifodinibius sp. S!AR15-10]|uniref:S9 family peptidase n=1 Tax=Aliifodinibius sp. S!AR15-10 TaxID=2950437 RepID=UPI00285E80AB|nr:prolyl oligopeptidase family serine peptidase [Aliifodinibius sp. S!AR15-10]MDR8392959.1 prolyl oligopeptidase family serine peptidase [Aliifodinibius sp. S!AR15-10]